MKETYKEFLARIQSFEKSETYFGNDYFKGNPSIAQKVGNDNLFQAFYGDTIVFHLDDATKEKLSNFIEQLYQTAPECFCEKLDSNTLHMTLHDLSNAPVLKDVAAEVFENELKVIEKSKEIKKFHKIKMKTKYIFNMVDISLVLGLYPTNEEEYNKLMELYDIFDDVKKLSYPLTPHITLAYYNVNGFDTEAAKALEGVVSKLNRNEMEIELELDRKHLYYQKFKSMNDYIDVISLGEV
ncbi:MAG: hypothetical protein IJA10_03870 [Lachnospiraceae bacterium]|nr:hypothetical protein [Lachnospiraceae bacterium]